MTWGGEHILQHADNVFLHCTPETCTILLTNVTLKNSIKKLEKRKNKPTVKLVSLYIISFKVPEYTDNVKQGLTTVS